MRGHVIGYLTVLCALSTAAITQYNNDIQTDALQTLIEELKKELRLDTNVESKNRNTFGLSNIRIPETVQSNGKLAVLGQLRSFPVKTYPEQYQRQSPLISAILNSKSDNLKEDIGVDKRQGRWDFDYGLGGGRFGKRFADYSLGGGRFGRDIDHVLHLDDVTDYEYADED